MSRNNLHLKIAHICPGLLETDASNVLALKNRAEWRDIIVDIEEISQGSDFIPARYDFYFIGSCPKNMLKTASEELYLHRENLLKACERGSVILGMGAGYLLMGDYYQPLEGEILAGVGLLDIRTMESEYSYTGNALAHASFLKPKTITGFEDNSFLTYISKEKESNTKPFMTIKRGKGNNNEDKTEGARRKNTFGTYLQGPFLAQNPHLCDYLTSLALEKKYKQKIRLPELDDDVEKYTHQDRVKAKY